MSKPVPEPDKRWGTRFEKALDALEVAESRLLGLAAFDDENWDAVWQDDARAAVGCVFGAKELLLSADRARAKHIKEHAGT